MNATASTHGILVSLLRCSSLPMAVLCPGSIREPSVHINTSNEAARVGSAAHKLVESLPTDGAIDYSRASEIADRYQCDENELRYLAHRAEGMWPKLKPSFPLANTEVGGEVGLKLTGLNLTGTIDLLSVWADTARIGDYKFGRLDKSYVEQMNGYSAIVYHKYPRVNDLTSTLIWVRDQDIENYHVSREESQEWIDRFERTVVQWDGIYRPHENCHHCPRFHACPAANSLAVANVEVIAGLPTETIGAHLSNLSAQQVIHLHRKVKQVSHICEAAGKAIRELVLKHGEIVGEDAMLTVANEPRRELDPIRTWPVVEALGFEQEDWAAVLKISVSKLEERVKNKAGYGNGAAAIRSLKQKLELAGAVDLPECLVVKERRI